MSKVTWKSYWEPTPKLFRAVGDTLLSVTGLVTGIGIYSDNKTLAMVSLISGIVGKFITNLATVAEEPCNDNPPPPDDRL